MKVTNEQGVSFEIHKGLTEYAQSRQRNLPALPTNWVVLDATPNINKFESKAEAIKFAIEFTANYTEDGAIVANLTAAQELFDFICKNVELPETQLAQWGDVIANATDIAEMVKQHFVELMNKEKANEQAHRE
jgi:hypothetical protein